MPELPSSLFWWRTLAVLCFVVSIITIILVLFTGIYWPLVFVFIPIGAGFGIFGKCGNTSPIIVRNY
uniref:Uncharacterized protein n=1 Tax=Meloidogyne incognita TaxID=6306 RepID=A0A914MPI6_MELIC